MGTGNFVGWKLFLDDDADGARRPAITVENPAWRSRMGLPRNPPDTWHLGEWIVARNYGEAEELLTRFGMPSFVSFDHDLGEERTGLDVARMIAERDLDMGDMPPGFAYEVHSANPVGRQNIRSYLESYLKFRESSAFRT